MYSRLSWHAAHQQPAKAPLRALPVRRHRDDVLHLEVIEQEAVDRAILSLGEVVLEPRPVQAPDALVTAVFAGEEHDGAVPGEELHHVLGAVEVDVVAIGPVQAADGVDVLELADAMFQGCEPCFEIDHESFPLSHCA